ncbi:ABC transporter permease [Paenibacillus dakarensis]|uniref:ABC transporter permease n=1 Tax=Paenibacillus dakarensis TaxID=1527293 RepID=UPI0006D53C1D|nr:ABC transporter permease [Paenibacillus dakarensis]
MNIMGKLTIRHMRQNKRRTLVTIIGVILSAAMITAVTTMGTSFIDLMKRQEIAIGGEWHVLYEKVNGNQIHAIRQDSETKSLSISRDIGYASVEETKNPSKPYMFIKEYNDYGFHQFNIELTAGRLPKNEHEIVISKEIVESAGVNYKIGDTITLNTGELSSIDDHSGEKLVNLKGHTYTIVGIIKPPIWESVSGGSYSVFSYLDESALGANDKADVSVIVKHVNKSIYTHAEQLAQAAGFPQEQVNYNNDLLRYYGITNDDSLNKTIYSLCAIIISIIIAGSISLIYNAFAISVTERSRYLGMLSSVGATRKQKRNSVFFEGAIIGLISIPLGIACGLAGIGVGFHFISPAFKQAIDSTVNLEMTVTPLPIIVTIIVSALTIFVSCYVPARRASKMSSIEAIRQSSDIKLTGKTVKTSRLVRAIFGIEAEIGLKNLKRNKRKYRATIFSLVISIVLFLSVSYFSNNLNKSVEMTQSGVNYNIEIDSRSGELDASFVQSIANLKEVEEYSVMKRANFFSWIDKDAIADRLKELAKQDESILENNKYLYNATLSALNDQSLKEYTARIGASYEELTDPEKLKAIIINQAVYTDEAKKKYVESEAIHSMIGDRLDLLPEGEDPQKRIRKRTIEVAALTDQRPTGIDHSWPGQLNIIVSEAVMDHLLAGDYSRVYGQDKLFLKSADPMKTESDIEKLNALGNYYIWNLYSDQVREEQMSMLVSVFTYGFILLITVIAVANIFNTISTSISLRKREFAVLRSIGMTPKRFSKMIHYESIFYGLKSLLYGLPLSLAAMFLIYLSLMNSFSFPFQLPWMSLVIVVIGVFIIVGSAMIYSSSKVRKENIIEAIKQENI